MDRFYLWLNVAALLTGEALNGIVLCGEEDDLDLESPSLSPFASSVPFAGLLQLSLGPIAPKSVLEDCCSL